MVASGNRESLLTVTRNLQYVVPLGSIRSVQMRFPQLAVAVSRHQSKYA